MALSLRETILIVGREVEITVLSRVKADKGLIQDEDLIKIFKPLIDKTEQRVRHEIADAEAKVEEKKAELDTDLKVSAIRSEIYNNAILFVNGKRKKGMPIHQAKRLRTALQEGLIPELKDLEVNYDKPTDADSDIEEDSIDRYAPDSTYWEKYCPSLKVSVKEPADMFISGSIPQLVKFIKASDMSFESLEDVALLVERLKEILYTPGSTGAIVSMLRHLNPLWKKHKISHEAFRTLLRAMGDIDSESCKNTLQLFEVFLEQRRLVPLTGKTAKSTEKKSKKVMGTCAAYDCPGDIYADSKVCGVQDGCSSFLCDECSEMGRVCEHHRG